MELDAKSIGKISHNGLKFQCRRNIGMELERNMFSLGHVVGFYGLATFLATIVLFFWM